MISIAMTTYNGERFLQEQLDSILNQDTPVDEIVIIDDNSSDRTYEILRRFYDDYKELYSIILIRNSTNIGYIANFYKAIHYTSGDYIFLCDQDDIWDRNKVSYMIFAINHLNAQLICSNYTIIDENGNESTKTYDIPTFIKKTKGYSKISMATLMMGNISQGCTYCFTSKVRDIYKKIHYDELIHDYQIMLIAAALDGAYYTAQKLIKYRIHSCNNVGFQEKKSLKHVDFIIKHKEPRVVTLLSRMKRETRVKDYYKCVMMQYLRIPIWGAILHRFFS